MASHLLHSESFQNLVDGVEIRNWPIVLHHVIRACGKLLQEGSRLTDFEGTWQYSVGEI